MKKRIGSGTPEPDTFFYDKDNQHEEATDEWDLFLGNLGIFPQKVEKYITELLDEDNKGKLKYIMSDLTQVIIEQNIEIWEYRCKRLYANENDRSP